MFFLDDDLDPALSNTRSFNNLLSGIFVVSEDQFSGFTLANLACIDPDNGTTIDIANRKAIIDLDLGESVTCTFTVAQRGTITIIEDTNPDGPQDFKFTDTGLIPTAFFLDDDADASLPNTRTFTNVIPGSYTVTQNAVAGFTLANLACTDPDNGSTVDLAARTATIDLDAGENITCTYTNS